MFNIYMGNDELAPVISVAPVVGPNKPFSISTLFNAHASVVSQPPPNKLKSIGIQSSRAQEIVIKSQPMAKSCESAGNDAEEGTRNRHSIAIASALFLSSARHL